MLAPLKDSEHNAAPREALYKWFGQRELTSLEPTWLLRTTMMVMLMGDGNHEDDDDDESNDKDLVSKSPQN